MIKRIIFDLDNTLIMWEKEYHNAFDKTFKYFNMNLTNEIKENLVKAAHDYENKYDIFTHKNMHELMEKYSNISLPHNFVEIWTRYLEYAIPENKNKELIDTLEYLNSKYELIVLTNWFTHQQKERLKNYDIFKYFKEVIGTDQVKNKPNKESFMKACNPYNIDECVMIGDSIKIDIEGAQNIGLRAILFDYNNKYTGNIENIKTIEELKNIF